MSTVVSFFKVRLSHGMQKWNAKLSNHGVMFEHVSRTSLRYLDDLGRHGTEMTVFLAGFDSQTCTSRFAIIFWDNVPFGSGIFVDICSRIVGNLGVDRASGNLFFIFVEHMHQVRNDNKCLKIQFFNE